MNLIFQEYSYGFYLQVRDMALKRDLAGWLDAKLTEIERRHSLDEKNSALLRAMAVKRFSKYSRATAGVSHTSLIHRYAHKSVP